MPHDESEDMIETKQLIKKLEALEAEAKESAKDRHRLNGATHSILNTVVQNTAAQDTVLDEILRSVARIEGCLLGDTEYKRDGLIADVVAIKAAQLTMHSKIEAVEDAVKSRTRAFVIGASVVGSIGAIVTWVKASGFINWLTS